MPGRDFCRFHGGRARAGSAHPSFKTGEHSRYSLSLTGKLRERYEQAVKSTNLQSLNDEIAVFEMRMSMLLEDVEATAPMLKRAIGLHQTAMKAATKGDGPAVAQAMQELGSTLERALTTARQWDEIRRVANDKRKLAESEARRVAAASEYLTVEQGFALVAALTSAIERTVKDPDARRAINTEFLRIVGRPGQSEPDGPVH